MGEFMGDRRRDPRGIICEETAAYLHDFAIRLGKEIGSKHHLESRSASDDRSDDTLLIVPVAPQVER